MITQTAALLLDAYRDLRARRLFWVALVLSGLVAGLLGCVGINDRGFTIFGHTFRSVFNTSIVSVDAFYRYLFIQQAIPWWLGCLATVLALTAVSGIFPDLISGGSIDLYLSKPISRLRLFLTKYVFGLMFAAFQVFVFCGVSFLVLGVRGGVWEPRVFAAVPLVTLFFSYLFAVCTLLGVLTRSSLSSLMWTLVFWLVVYAVHASDGQVTLDANAVEQRLKDETAALEKYEGVLARVTGPNRANFERNRDLQQKLVNDDQAAAASARWWQRVILNSELALPKTNETVDYMSRYLVDPDPISRAVARRREQMMARNPGFFDENSIRSYEFKTQTQKQYHEELNNRSLAWIVGTSLCFEAGVLVLAAWLFCRRDY